MHTWRRMVSEAISVLKAKFWEVKRAEIDAGPWPRWLSRVTLQAVIDAYVAADGF